MKTVRSSFKVISSSFILFSCILLGSPLIAHAGPVKGCAVKYYAAAQALDQKRASCGLDENGNSVCKVISKINIPVSIEGFSFNINLGGAYRFLNKLGFLPNKFRRSAKLIQQAQAGSGGLFKRTSKKIARQVPGTSREDVAKAISKANEDGSLCADDHLLSVKQIRHLVEDEIVRM